MGVDNSSKRKSEFLGIPYGTAVGRLRKKVLFHLLQKHKENVCVRCTKEIQTVEDLSIEHIKPWEGRSVELFWNMDNVSFSHLKCNIPHFQGASKMRKQPPEGMAWCRAHKCFEPVGDFWKDEKRWNGLRKTCKESSAAFKNEWRDSRREKGLPVT